MSKKGLPASIFAVVLAVALASGASAQVAASLAQLDGIVRDEGGGVLQKVAITLRSVDTNRQYSTATKSEGAYLFPGLPPGSYELTAETEGFSKLVRGGIRLRVGETATADLTLLVAGRGERIEVTDEQPAVDPSRTEVSHVVDREQIENLPNSGRLFTDFALLTPGVTTGRTSLQSTITEFEVTRVSFGGMRDLSNEIMVDGADAINTVTGSQRAAPPQDAVSEFRVVGNSFGADYGRALGGIVNIVTKSGTNNLRGSVYEYSQNNAFDARSLLQPAPDPDALRQNQFGVAAGGPVVRDRTFFFANYEGQRLAQSPTYPAELTGNLAFFNAAKAALGLAPENLNILQTGNHDSGLVKLDHAFSDRHRLSLRYNVEDGRSLNLLVGNTVDGGGVAAPSSGHNAFIRDQSLVGSITSAPGPNLVNTFLAQWARRVYDFPGVTGQPALDIPNELMFGHNFGVFDFIAESRTQLSNSTSAIAGRHLFRFGVDANFLMDKVTWPGFTPMRIVLPGDNCLVEFANYVNPAANLQQGPALGTCPLPPSLNGTPVVFWATPAGNGPLAPGYTPPPLPTNWKNAYLPSLTNDFDVHLNHQYFGVFAEDQWKATSRLTVNYGVRWDVETGLGAFINSDFRNFGPRLGVAYAPDTKTVFRAGFGIFFDRYSLPFIFVTAPERPVTIPGVSLPGVPYGSASAGWVLNQLTPGPGGFPADAAKTLLLTGQLPSQFTTGPCPPSCTAGAALIDHNSRTPYAEQASFQIDREIARGMTAGIGYLFAGAHHQVRAEDLNVAPPVGNLPDGKALFNGPLYQNAGLLYLTDDSGNSVYHGLTARIAQRYKQVLRFEVNYTFSKTLDDGTFTTFVSTPQDLYNRSLERANSNQDVRHRVVSSFSVEAPQRSLLRNFELSGIVTLQSARPFTLFVGYDANGDTNPVTDRVGQSARNTYWGDALYTADLRVSRSFYLRERLRLVVGVDGFNAFNRANVDEVNSVYGFADFLGPVPSHYGDAAGSPANPEFGTPRTVFNPRRLQISVRLTF